MVPIFVPVNLISFSGESNLFYYLREVGDILSFGLKFTPAHCSKQDNAIY